MLNASMDPLHFSISIKDRNHIEYWYFLLEAGCVQVWAQVMLLRIAIKGVIQN